MPAGTTTPTNTSPTKTSSPEKKRKMEGTLESEYRKFSEDFLGLIELGKTLSEANEIPSIEEEGKGVPVCSRERLERAIYVKLQKPAPSSNTSISIPRNYTGSIDDAASATSAIIRKQSQAQEQEPQKYLEQARVNLEKCKGWLGYRITKSLLILGLYNAGASHWIAKTQPEMSPLLDAIKPEIPDKKKAKIKKDLKDMIGDFLRMYKDIFVVKHNNGKEEEIFTEQSFDFTKEITAHSNLWIMPVKGYPDEFRELPFGEIENIFKGVVKQVRQGRLLSNTDTPSYQRLDQAIKELVSFESERSSGTPNKNLVQGTNSLAEAIKPICSLEKKDGTLNLLYKNDAEIQIPNDFKSTIGLIADIKSSADKFKKTAKDECMSIKERIKNLIGDVTRKRVELEDVIRESKGSSSLDIKAENAYNGAKLAYDNVSAREIKKIQDECFNLKIRYGTDASFRGDADKLNLKDNKELSSEINLLNLTIKGYEDLRLEKEKDKSNQEKNNHLKVLLGYFTKVFNNAEFLHELTKWRPGGIPFSDTDSRKIPIAARAIKDKLGDYNEEENQSLQFSAQWLEEIGTHAYRRLLESSSRKGKTGELYEILSHFVSEEKRSEILSELTPGCCGFFTQSMPKIDNIDPKGHIDPTKLTLAHLTSIEKKLEKILGNDEKGKPRKLNDNVKQAVTASRTHTSSRSAHLPSEVSMSSQYSNSGRRT